MNKKGFTLVELLAVMTVLSIIMIIIFTGLGSSKDMAEEKMMKIERDSITDAAISYYISNKDINDFFGDTYTIVCKVQVKDLKSSKFIEINKYLNSDINDETYVKVTDDSGVITSEIVPETNVSSLSSINNCKKIKATNLIKNLVPDADPASTEVITVQAPDGSACTNTLAYDGTADNNLRYVGADPCNYVTFNNETWRIIGVMNNIDDGTGRKETRIKLIRATYLGLYAWDTSDSSVNNGNGINDWTQADLMRELNGDYLDTALSANTNWYNGKNNARTGVFDYTKRLNEEAQGLIGNAKWYLGGIQQTIEDLIPNTMYTKERGTEVWGSKSGQNCNDAACPRTTEWTGKVALIYPSDYGYATAGGATTNRAACIGTLSTYNNSSEKTWYNNSYNDCISSDWLKSSTGWNVMLSPNSNYSDTMFRVYINGYVSYNGTYTHEEILPAVYLKSGVMISGGSGTESDPYTLE